jgi:hypothetical protein
MKTLPKTFAEAVAIGLQALSPDQQDELREIAFVDPHTRYRTDFEKVVGVALGLAGGENFELRIDVAENHADDLHFLDTSGRLAEPQAVLRVVLAAMVRKLRGSDQANACWR